MIRELKEDDLNECISIVESVWKFTDIFHPKDLATFFLKVYTLGSLADSNYGIVAEENNRIVGFLYGKSLNGSRYKTILTGIKGQLKTLIGLLRIKNVSFRKKREYLRMINTHEINRLKAEPNREYEVNLFAVLPKMQGQGIGKELMSSFINKCKNDGVNRITLDTDEECNYKFYEHFGYKKIAEFNSPIQELYSQKSGISYVYELKID